MLAARGSKTSETEVGLDLVPQAKPKRDIIERDFKAKAAVSAREAQRCTQNAYTKAVDEWVLAMSKEPSPALARKAKQALARILQEPS
jgi:hypothetical protein